MAVDIPGENHRIRRHFRQFAPLVEVFQMQVRQHPESHGNLPILWHTYRRTAWIAPQDKRATTGSARLG